jgi:hypothetical protein
MLGGMIESRRSRKLAFALTTALLGLSGLCGCGSTAATSAPLGDGFYLVLEEADSAAALAPASAGERIVVDDGKVLADPSGRPPVWLRVHAAPDVPLIVESVPDRVDRIHEHPSLRLTLAAEHARTLEEVTTAHLGESVALVIGGEVVSKHHIRAAIQGGRVEITRCHDDACEKILVRLQETQGTKR